MSTYTCLILTHADKKTGEILLPHLSFLKESNPDVEIHIIVGEHHPRGKRYNWRNGDQPLRKWWKENGHLVETDCVAVIEWDTLVNCLFPEIPWWIDLVGKQMFVEPLHLKDRWIKKRMADPDWHQDYWWWWSEIPKLELGRQKAMGLISLGCFLMRRWVLDAVCNPWWDKIYNKDIISELRFPSIAAAEGATVGEISLPFVDHSDMLFSGEKEIFHPIKEPQC